MTRRIQDLRAEEAMTPTPACLEERCTFAGALSFLVRHGYQSAPVVDSAGRVRGLLTREGLLGWLSNVVQADGEVALQGLMARPIGPAVEAPLRCQADAPLPAVARLLVQHQAAAALVLRGDDLVGIVTPLDVARAVGWAEAPGEQRRGHCFTAGDLPQTVAEDAADQALMALLPGQRP